MFCYMETSYSRSCHRSQRVHRQIIEMCTLFNVSQASDSDMELRHQATPDLHEETNDTQVAGLSPRAEDEQEASGEVPEHEAQQDEPQQDVRARRRQTENEVSEVEIPNVGRIMVRADADGYNEEVSVGSQHLVPMPSWFYLFTPAFLLHRHVTSQMMLTPAMQGVILAIAKARQTFDKEGPEAGLIKV